MLMLARSQPALLLAGLGSTASCPTWSSPKHSTLSGVRMALVRKTETPRAGVRDKREWKLRDHRNGGRRDHAFGTDR